VPIESNTRVAFVDRQTTTLLRALARALFYAAAVVLFMSIIGATQAFTSDAQLVGLPELEQEGRTAAAIFALAGGITAAGILAGLGGIIVVLLSDRGREDRG
jgi:hypothetical protein